MKHLLCLLVHQTTVVSNHSHTCYVCRYTKQLFCLIITRYSHTLASVPSTQYPAMIHPLRLSVHQLSNSSRDSPLCIIPGLARTMDGPMSSKCSMLCNRTWTVKTKLIQRIPVPPTRKSDRKWSPNFSIWHCLSGILFLCISFNLFLCISFKKQRWRGYSNAAVCVWLGEWVRPPVTLCLVDMIQTTVFAQSLSNFTCKLRMMRGGTLLIWPTGSKVKVNFGTLCMRPCGQDTDYSLSPITFKLHMMRGGTLLILGHEVKCQDQLWYCVYKIL